MYNWNNLIERWNQLRTIGDEVWSHEDHQIPTNLFENQFKAAVWDDNAEKANSILTEAFEWYYSVKHKIPYL